MASFGLTALLWWLATAPLAPHSSSRRNPFLRFASLRSTAARESTLRLNLDPAEWAKQAVDGIGDLLVEADDAAAVRRVQAREQPPAAMAAARLARSAGRADAALADYDRVLKQRPGDQAALRGRASALAEAGRLAEAVAAYEELLARQPDSPADLYNLGVTLCRANRMVEACDRFRDAVRRDGSHAAGWFNLAAASQRLGKIGEAVDAWRAYVALRPDDGTGWFNLGVAWAELERFGEAADAFGRAASLAPKDVDAHLNHGLALRGSGRELEALPPMERAASLAPDDVAVIVELVDLHRELAAVTPQNESHRRAAVEWADRGLAVEPNHETLRRLKSELRP